MSYISIPFLGLLVAILGVTAVAVLAIAVLLRRVVATNEVHIVQSAKSTTSFGKDTPNGNVYYEWPSWLPFVGVTKIVLPVSVFDLSLSNYEAYDVGRVPFVVDIVAFFRISDSNLAAARVESFEELQSQLLAIVQGAIRTVLASHDIDKIMLDRSTFGRQFTEEVQDQLKNWGVEPVKNIELMDIRDAAGNRVVHNIMEKKKSLIEMQSRTEVAVNIKQAQTAEIEAQREVDIKAQEAEQLVGERTAQKTKAVGIANEQAQQEIKEQQRLTKEKEMAVRQVETVKQADIVRQANVIKAEEVKQTKIIDADADKQKTILIAEGQLEAKQKEAIGITVEGTARADAEKAMQLAPVEAQIVLAKEIGNNDGYQKYLITIRQVEAAQVIGVEQARALVDADVKIIANSGDPVSGATHVMDLFTPKGGTQIAAMMEAIAQTPVGAKIVETLTGTDVKVPKKQKIIE